MISPSRWRSRKQQRRNRPKRGEMTIGGSRRAGVPRDHGTPFHFLTTGCEVSKFHGPRQEQSSFGTYELLDMPRCKKP